MLLIITFANVFFFTPSFDRRSIFESFKTPYLPPIGYPQSPKMLFYPKSNQIIRIIFYPLYLSYQFVVFLKILLFISFVNMKIISMTPARMGSQRLKRKNLRPVLGVPLVTRALRKCKSSHCFDEIWLNSEDLILKNIAKEEGCSFHHRPSHLASNSATSEDFIYEFLYNHECDYIVQVHSIAPLLSVDSINSFVSHLKLNQPDVLMSVELIQLESLFQNQPINFDFGQKTNSQDLKPLQRISWSITAWKRKTFLQAVDSGNCATYFGDISYFPVNMMASHVIKTDKIYDRRSTSAPC